MGTFEKVEIEWMNMCVLYKAGFSRRHNSSECSRNILFLLFLDKKVTVKKCDKLDPPQFVIKS